MKIKKLKKIITAFFFFLKDKKKKNYSRIFKEIILLWYRDRSFPIYYFGRLVYQREAGFYLDYLNMKTIKKLWASKELHLNTAEILFDKVKFNQYCTKNGIPVAKLYFSNVGNQFRSDDKMEEIESFDKFKEYLAKGFSLFGITKIFVKPNFGSLGTGCFILNIEDLNNPAILKDIYEEIINGEFLFEELIKQHSAISEINPFSVNTIRVDTYIDDLNEVQVLFAMIRFGRKGSVVDNASSGGFFVPINLNNFSLGEFGTQFLENGNNQIFKHPDTGYVFSGLKIPYSEETVALVKKTASAIGDRLTGWDIAITPDGPLIIEGNVTYHMGMQDTLIKGYKKHPIIKEIVKKYT